MEQSDPNPISNRPTVRGKGGQFAPGTRGGPGSPHSAYAVKFRLLIDSVLDEVVTKERLVKAAKACMAQAEEGDVICFREILSRMVGPPESRLLESRVEALEASRMNGKTQTHADTRTED